MIENIIQDDYIRITFSRDNDADNLDLRKLRIEEIKEMKILAVDTSSRNCSVSIVEVDKNKNINVIAQGNNDDERTHSVKLMPMIDNMFKTSNLSLDNIDLLACCLGPGSFTGIRIGIATMKAFADVKNIPTVGVTSLESLAYNIEENATICPIIDCKNNNVYSAMFELKDNTYVQIGDNIADTIEVALENCKLHSENQLFLLEMEAIFT